MSQPPFVPPTEQQPVRQTSPLPPARSPKSERPGDVRTTHWPSAPQMGSQGPDQGYALRLARLFLDTVTLDEHEHRDDILAGTIAVALQRASHFGRGPIMSDVAVAFALWGIQPVGSQEHTAVRRAYFSGAAHDYVRVRAIVDGVRDEAIALNVPEIAERNWRELLREPRQGSSRIDGGVS